MRDGSRGPLEVDVMICRVQAKIDRRIGDEERLVVIRFVNGDSIQHDDYLTNANATVNAMEFARVSKLGHTIEEALFNQYCGMRRAKPAWRMIKFAIGMAGTIASRCRW